MKISEVIITAVLVIGAFVIGFMKNTNSSPMLENTPTNTVLNVESSSTNEEQNLMMMEFDLENEVEVIEIDSLITDSIPQDTVMVIEEYS
ncbi:MAG TPA: hypothetical protein DCR01_00325 [Flavobacteriales bacterium]|nr:hypothetical protein [Flavobacteriales bacterium]|tara:strand:+ start:1355 stop:1624 length:270 start_codon:yes stop_codon:yes gene_type:complete